jgi:uncharacterized membrane protein
MFNRLGKPYGVSNDGGVVVGEIIFAQKPAVWDTSTGDLTIIAIPVPPGSDHGGYESGIAYDVTPDGSVVVGKVYWRSLADYTAFRWSKADGAVSLGDTFGAQAVSDDATRVLTQQGLWQDGVIQPTALFQRTNLSGDGQVLVGAKSNLAAYWTQSTGLVELGDFAGGAISSIANAVSTDGSVIVGSGTDATGSIAFRWTAATGLQALGPGSAVGVSGDGLTVVGNNSSGGFIWDSYYGYRDLKQVFQSLGLGQFNVSVNAISSNGRYLVGGSTNGTYVAQIPEPSSILLLVCGAITLITAYAARHRSA